MRQKRGENVTGVEWFRNHLIDRKGEHFFPRKEEKKKEREREKEEKKREREE